MASIWTPAMVADLTRLWGEGLSASEIGRQMGIEKNAVCGKASRLKLPQRGSPIARPAGWKRKVKLRPPKPAVAAPAPSSQQCRYPIGHPGEPGFHFCTERSLLGKPYCEEHQRLCYTGKVFKAEAG